MQVQVEIQKDDYTHCWAGEGWDLFPGQWKTNRGWDRWEKRTQASFTNKSKEIFRKGIQYVSFFTLKLKSFILFCSHQTANQINGNIILSKWVVLRMKGNICFSAFRIYSILKSLNVFFKWQLIWYVKNVYYYSLKK